MISLEKKNLFSHIFVAHVDCQILISETLISQSTLSYQRISSLYLHFNSYELKHLKVSFLRPRPGCSKLTTSLVNETLKFQTLISQICQYFLLKKYEKLLQCKSFSHFCNKKHHCIWLLSCKTLNELTS